MVPRRGKILSWHIQRTKEAEIFGLYFVQWTKQISLTRSSTDGSFAYKAYLIVPHGYVIIPANDTINANVLDYTNAKSKRAFRSGLAANLFLQFMQSITQVLSALSWTRCSVELFLWFSTRRFEGRIMPWARLLSKTCRVLLLLFFSQTRSMWMEKSGLLVLF